MATFVDSLIKIALLIAQVISLLALGDFLNRMKKVSTEREKNFGEERQKHNEWLEESGLPPSWLVKSVENYVPDYRRVKRSRFFWNNGGGNSLFVTYLVIQLIACTGYLNFNFAAGLR